MYLATVLILVTVQGCCDAVNEFKILKDDVLKNYNPLESPANASEKVVVYTYFYITYVDMDREEGGLKLQGYFVGSWNDTRLKWDRSQYSNISRLHLPPDKIWTPTPAIVVNVRDRQVTTYKFQYKYTVSGYKGRMYGFANTYIRYLTNVCDHETELWPHDTKLCTFTLSFPSCYHQNVSIKPKSVSYYQKKSSWIIMSTNGNMKYNNETKQDELKVELHLVRNGNIQFASLVAPTYVQFILALVLLWMDPRSPERIILTGLLIICHCSNLKSLSAHIPLQGTETPKIMKIRCFALLMTVLHLIVTIISGRILTTSYNPVWLSVVTTWSIRNKVISKTCFFHISEKAAAELLDEDESSLLATNTKKLRNQWRMISHLLNLAVFLLLIPTSLSLFYYFQKYS